MLFKHIVILSQLFVFISDFFHPWICLQFLFVLTTSLLVGCVSLFFEYFHCFFHLSLGLLEALDGILFVFNLVHQLHLNFIVPLIHKIYITVELLIVLVEVLKDGVQLHLADRLLSFDWVWFSDCVLGMGYDIFSFSIELGKAQLKAFMVVEKDEATDVWLQFIFALVRKRLDLKLIKEFNHFGAHFLLNHIEIGAILLQLLDDFVLVWEVLLFDEFRPGHIPLNLTKLALKRLNDISILISNFINWRCFIIIIFFVKIFFTKVCCHLNTRGASLKNN